MMRSSVSSLVLAVLALASILMLTYAASTPVFFSAENQSKTLYHRDLQYETATDPADAGMVLGLMDGLLQDTAEITIRIKAHDLDGAEEDLRAALEHAEHLQNVVVDLDLEGSDADTFARENEQCLRDLYEIVNDSGRFDEVRSIEIREHGLDANRTRSIVYEGEALNRTITEGVSSVTSRQDRIAAIGEAYGLNTTEYRQSLGALEALPAAVAAGQQSLAAAAGTLPGATISIGVVPGRVTYNDTLAIAGTVSNTSGEGNASVEIILDSRPAGTALADSSGAYRYLLPVREIASGTHFVYAGVGPALSGVAQFAVLPEDTSVTLAVTPSSGIETAGASCTGRILTADGEPVADAPVSFIIDGRTGTETVTGADGWYRHAINLTSGTHTITAVFSGEGFPLNGSSSQPVTINLIPGFGSPAALLAVAFAGITSIVGGNWYIRRSRNSVPHPEKSLQTTWRHQTSAMPETESRQDTGMPADEDLQAVADALLSAADPREGVALLYHALLERLGPVTQAPALRTATPREVLKNYHAREFAPDLAAFVELHERVCYAGRVPDAGERQRLGELFIMILACAAGGGDE
ncbi:DUF4129 domain-containing protein [Methanoculleus sp. FWC-SCC1]|uniref:DUF4129 domain-containing protein n=1 Tax=Methanoculleus frigidifontis TaxID=2584085 RepID=A0ABT8MBN4_9EURY|nr:DUF4129 domain-containing protein [Methanoculleus sp. FWC-SCC1]MDN7025345.1 DUF4129 domain-containing protein [Methanoculleus sp. FWC-SCC1]